MYQQERTPSTCPDATSFEASIDIVPVRKHPEYPQQMQVMTAPLSAELDFSVPLGGKLGTALVGGGRPGVVTCFGRTPDL